jgi:hypothetical protein
MDVSLTKSEGIVAGELRRRFDDLSGQTAKKVFAHVQALQGLRQPASWVDGVGDGNHLYSCKPVQSSLPLVISRFSPATKAALGLK